MDEKCHLPFYQSKKMLGPSSHQPLQLPPAVLPEGIQDGEKQDFIHWCYTAMVNIKGMVSVTADSCIFPYIGSEKSSKFFNLQCLVFFN